MTVLAWVLTRSGGWPRMLLVFAATAVVSALLLTVTALLRVPEYLNGQLFDLLQDADRRRSVAFASALLTVPPLLLMHQAVRLGTVARERRFAALRVVGATPADVRLLGAIEVGLPALAGALAAVPIHKVLEGHLPRLLPPVATPAWWQTVLVVGAITGAAGTFGWRASRPVVLSPLQVARRQAPPPPRPWGLLPLAGAGAIVVSSIVAPTEYLNLPGSVTGLFGPVTAQLLGQLMIFTVIALVVFGFVSLSSWMAYVVGRQMEWRANSAALLLAARRLATEPRPPGRAAAAVGGIAAVAGGTTFTFGLTTADSQLQAFHLSVYTLIGAGLLSALLLVTATVAVHSVEFLLEDRRTVALLIAAGTPLREIQRSLRFEAALVAMPSALFGVLLGLSPTALLLMFPGSQTRTTLAAVALATVVATLALTWLAINIATRIVNPWVLRASDTDWLRAE